MEKAQKDSLFEVLVLFQTLGISKHVILIGSWVEYFYDEFFSSDYYPNIATSDIDLLYRNIRLPNHKVPLILALRELGFIYDENPLTKVARFYKGNILELEFITRVVGQDQMHYEINSIGIIAEGLREVSLLEKHCVEIHREGFTVLIPHPAAYVIHKILINEKRKGSGKAEKDMRSIKDILFQIRNDRTQRDLFIQIIQALTKKEMVIFKRVCQINEINLDFMQEH